MYARFSLLVRVNVYVKRSLDPVVQLLCQHQRHAAATTTHASETVQVHKKKYSASKKKNFRMNSNI